MRQSRGTEERESESGRVAAVQDDHQLLSHVSSTLITSLSFDAPSRNPHTVHNDYPAEPVFSVFISSPFPDTVCVCVSLVNVLCACLATRTHTHTRDEPGVPFANTFRTAPRDTTASISVLPPWFPSSFPDHLLPTMPSNLLLLPLPVNDGLYQQHQTRYVGTPLLRFSRYRLENARTSYLCLREPRRRRGNRRRILADDADTSTLPGIYLATGWRHLQDITATVATPLTLAPRGL